MIWKENKIMIRLIVAAFAIIIGAPFQFGYANGVMNSMSGAMQGSRLKNELT